jgi:hypothetical protein
MRTYINVDTPWAKSVNSSARFYTIMTDKMMDNLDMIFMQLVSA